MGWCVECEEAVGILYCERCVEKREAALRARVASLQDDRDGWYEAASAARLACDKAEARVVELEDESDAVCQDCQARMMARIAELEAENEQFRTALRGIRTPDNKAAFETAERELSDDPTNT